jgi:hypothetical protein
VGLQRFAVLGVASSVILIPEAVMGAVIPEAAAFKPFYKSIIF